MVAVSSSRHAEGIIPYPGARSIPGCSTAGMTGQTQLGLDCANDFTRRLVPDWELEADHLQD